MVVIEDEAVDDAHALEDKSKSKKVARCWDTYVAIPGNPPWYKCKYCPQKIKLVGSTTTAFNRHTQGNHRKMWENGVGLRLIVNLHFSSWRAPCSRV